MDFFVKCTLTGSKTANGMEFPIFSATGSVPVKAFSAGVSLLLQRKYGQRFGCVSVVWAAHKQARGTKTHCEAPAL